MEEEDPEEDQTERGTLGHAATKVREGGREGGREGCGLPVLNEGGGEAGREEQMYEI